MDGLHLMQDIPKLYTALAEWLACLVFVLLLKKRFCTWKTITVLSVSLPLFCIIQYIIGIMPLAFWMPFMIVSMGMMFMVIYICANIQWTGAGFCFAIAFTMAEFAASLEWQIYSFISEKGFDHIGIKISFLVICYAGLFTGAYFMEKRYLSSDRRLQMSKRGMFGFLLSAIAIFLMSNISYVYPNTPFSTNLGMEIFYIRTLVDFAGLVLLCAQQDRLREIQLEKELAATNTILLRQYEQYQQSQESIDLINHKYHDLKHQISVIRAESSEEKRNVYLDEMESGIKMYEAQNKTGNKVLDTILTAKNLYCAQHDINFTCVADGTLVSFMDVMDLCTIFGNALDNAIESVEKLEDTNKRIIRVAVFSQGAFVMLRFENYFESEIDRNHSVPATTKKNKEYHGFGLKSIQKTAEKYKASMTVHAEANWFHLRILIPTT